MSGTSAERSLKLRYARSGRKTFVRTVASIVPRKVRRIRSWSSEVTPRRSCEDRRADLVDLLLREPRAIGSNLRLEQTRRAAPRSAGSRRARRSIVLGEAGRHALAVVAVRAQDRDLAPREAAGDDEPVQRVGLGLAAPHGRDRLGDAVGRLAEVEDGAARIQHAEVVDVDLALAERAPVGTSSTTRSPSASRIGMKSERSILPPVLYSSRA